MIEIPVHCKYDALLPLSEFVPNPLNANDHPADQIDALILDFETFGIRHPIISCADSHIMAVGHGRLLAAKKKGLTTFPVVYQKFRDADELNQFAIADNAVATWATLNLKKINEMLPAWGPDFNIDALCIKDFELEPADKHGDKDADYVPEITPTTIQLGDLFALGQHRLLCGDSTDKESVQKLMNGEKADMVFTDPPYGINVRGQDGRIGGGTQGSAKRQEIYGDEKQFNIKPIMKLPANQFFLFGGNFFAHELPRSTHWIIWNKHQKDEPVKSDFSDAELIWTNLDRKSVRPYKWGWTGRFRAGNQKDELKRKEHPCQKPVGLIENIFKDYEAKLIIDPFLGSGSTLIACEKTNRKCYGMEIDPQYCQVIIDRWEKFTGQKAIKL